jgi:glutathione S-transferase
MAALGVMDAHLAAHPWFGPGAYSIADIALYAYTHVADEGGFDLAGFPHIHRWLVEIRAQPNHIGLLQETSAAPVVTLAGAPVPSPA